MAAFEQYYEEELRYLQEGGKEFSEAFPERARYLNIHAVEDRDPYVERLFEGFAFLCARIRQKLDDDFPEFTQNLLEMVAPSFLRCIPSFAMLQFQVKVGALTGEKKIPKGTQVLSRSVGLQNAVCRFQTTQDTLLYPIQLENFERNYHPVYGEGFQFHFTVDPTAETETLSIAELPMYLHGERPLVYFLYYFLTARVKKTMIEFEGKQIELGGQETILTGGFLETENLWPNPGNSFEGSRLLQEFFCFEEKFRYIRFQGLDKLSKFPKGRFSLCIYFEEPLPEGKRIKVENFKLYAVPLVNLFETQTEPVNLNHKHFEYSLRPSSQRTLDAYEVTEVIGIDKVTGKRRNYQRFQDFRHGVFTTGEKGREPYYQIRQELRGGKNWSTYIAIGNTDAVTALSEEVLSVTILASDSGLPRESMLEDSITVPSADFPNVCSFTNFTRPTPPIYPPKADHYLWYVLSHMNMNYRSLCEKGNLRETLSLYDWTHSPINRKILEGIFDAEAKKKDFLQGTQLVRGTEINVQIKDGTFAETGELFIFARVLLSFFTQYTSINHLVALRLECVPSGKVLALDALEGTCHSI